MFHYILDIKNKSECLTLIPRISHIYSISILYKLINKSVPKSVQKLNMKVNPSEITEISLFVLSTYQIQILFLYTYTTFLLYIYECWFYL